jgi:lipid-A-disaccharide synthase
MPARRRPAACSWPWWPARPRATCSPACCSAAFRRWPGAAAAGIGGPKMAAQGFEAWWPHDKLAVRGYVEVLRHYREIAGIRDALGERLLRRAAGGLRRRRRARLQPGAGARLKAAGIKTVHFVCPSIWAWRGGRARKMAAAATTCCACFPSSPTAARGTAWPPPTSAIRWPMPSRWSRRARQPRGAGPGRGRRRWWPCCRAAGAQRDRVHRAGLPAGRGPLHRSGPAALRAAGGAGPARLLEPLVARHARRGVPLQLLDGQSHAALAACDVTLIASGTATLEAALFKRPMVIGYRMHP